MAPRYIKPARDIILDFLKKMNKPVKLNEIVKGTGIAYNTVRGRLYELKRKGLVQRTPEGWIELE
ncbi:MAG: helix-turn-helix domain-containing protein [Candidatus Methanomethylicia archaeon]